MEKVLVDKQFKSMIKNTKNSILNVKVKNNYDVDALAPTIILKFYLMTFDWNEKQKIFYKKMSNVHGQNYYYMNLNFSRFNT